MFYIYEGILPTALPGFGLRDRCRQNLRRPLRMHVRGGTRSGLCHTGLSDGPSLPRLGDSYMLHSFDGHELNGSGSSSSIIEILPFHSQVQIYVGSLGVLPQCSLTLFECAKPQLYSMSRGSYTSWWPYRSKLARC